MSSNSVRPTVAAIGFFALLLFAAQADAACCGGATTAFYPSTYSTYYAGSYAAYYPTTASTGWYPGYWMDRIRTRLWGSPTTYVAAYPTTTYAASYAPAYTASYAPAYTASYSPSYSVGYSAPACSSCSTCQSCTAGYAPSACSTCSTCTVPSTVTQTSYVQQQPGCATCGTGVQTPSQVQTQQGYDSSSSSTRTPDEAVQTFDSNGTSTNSNTQPAVPQDTPLERQGQRQPVDATPETQPGPGDDTTDQGVDPEVAPYKVEGTSGDSSTFFEAPKLHDPNDRTATRVLAPVKTALYKQPVSYRGVAAQPRPQQRITAEQARQDAIGWTSASN